MNYYQRYLRKIRRGVISEPRGFKTTASFNETFEFVPGTCWRRPHDNPGIGFIEGLQFISGTENKEAIEKVAPSVNIDLFGPTSFYGPRTIGQFDRIINELRKDKDSRRAIILVAHDDDTSETLPCTISIQFSIHPITNLLNSCVSLRSSDAVWGLPYDMIQYGMVHKAVASCLDLECGTSVVNIANAHIYEDHNGGKTWFKYKFNMPRFSEWIDYINWANSIIDSRPSRIGLELLFNLTDLME